VLIIIRKGKVMGAEYRSDIIDGNLTEEELKQKFFELKEQDEYNYGHAGYTGTFAEKMDIDIIDGVMTGKEAEEYTQDNNDKWENAFAIKLDDGRWYIGGWCSS
jgi:hypothetical protein